MHAASTAPPPSRLARTVRPHAIAREVALIVAAWFLYFGVRAISEGRTSAAVAHARALLRLEDALGVDWEAGFQRAALHHHTLVTLANWVYIWGHWPVIAAVAVWLYRREPSAYRLLRNAMFISGAIGLAVFALYPVAPPRLMPLGLVDSVTTWSHAYRVLQPPALTNPYAAMPSLHFGWDLLVGVMLVWYGRRRVVRAAGVALPAAMAIAVVATANHFVLDVVAGAALALLGLAVASRLGRDTMRA
jgi:PAP2 superfamily